MTGSTTQSTLMQRIGKLFFRWLMPGEKQVVLPSQGLALPSWALAHPPRNRHERRAQAKRRPA